MTPDGPSNPRLPDEADLLAWVEGEPLSPEANASVAKALMADPVLARKMELMRADRLALASLSQERAPEGLIEGVESALQPVLERELLLGLKDGEPADSPVVSMVRPEKRGIFQTFLADRAGRRMALAASLLVLVGGATWWATMTFSRGSGPKPIGPVALDKPGAGRDPIAAPVPAAPETMSIDEGTRIAMSGSGEAESAALKIGSEPVKPETPGNASIAPEAPATLAAAEVMGPVKAPMDAALAAELARERKLVIRVVSQEASHSPRRACDRIRKECNGNAWKLASQVSPELTVALDAKPFEVQRSSPVSIEPETPAFAGSDAGTPIVGPPVPRDIPVIEETEPQPVYLVQARLDAATMTQLKTTLEKAGHGDEVVFEERYEQLPLTPGGAPVLTPQAVLWWTNPPAGWTSWGEVPVVIEPK